MKRKIGHYKVCHPYEMSKETTGYWNGKNWIFSEIDEKLLFIDDDLNWIIETRLKSYKK